MARVVVRRLDVSVHKVRRFSCENPDYTTYLRAYGKKNMEMGMSTVYVAAKESDEAEILGYTTLSMGNVNADDVDDAVRGHLPRYPIPVLHLGKLATSKDHKGKGIGDLLIAHAAYLAVKLADQVGCHALQLDAETDDLVKYYAERDFIRMSVHNRLMYLPVATIRNGLEDR